MSILLVGLLAIISFIGSLGVSKFIGMIWVNQSTWLVWANGGWLAVFVIAALIVVCVRVGMKTLDVTFEGTGPF